MTSTTVSPPRPLPGWLKNTLLATGVVALCWAAAIAYWRSAENAPGTGELALVLLALPLVLLITLWAIKKRLTGQPVAAVVPVTHSASKPVTAEWKLPPLAILATALRAPHGASAEELAAAIAEGKAHADLDPELIDDQGFPVATARREDAVDEALQEEFNDWLEKNEKIGLSFSAAQWRALTLGTAVVRDLASEAASILMPSEGTPPVLQLIPLLPAEWTVEHRAATVMWFKQQVIEFGWPAASMYCVDLPGDREHALIKAFGKLAHDASTPGHGVVALVIACDSQIDQEAVDRWQTRGVLLTTSGTDGLTPGEGAAGMLLTDLQQAQCNKDLAYAVLEPFLDARHDVSTDTSKHTNTKLLLSLAERACKAAAIEPTDVAMIVADTGSRANRMLELMGVTSTTFPQLENTAEVAPVGVATGTCGVVPGITTLALAHHHALARAAPVLYASNEDAHLRCTALVRPAPSM